MQKRRSISSGRQTQATQAMYAETAVAIAEGRLDDARTTTRMALERSLTLEDRFLQVWGIEYVASIELATGNHEKAALLAGAGEAGRERIGGGWRPQTIGLEDAQLVLIRELGNDRAQELLAPGRTLSLEEAVAAAIE